MKTNYYDKLRKIISGYFIVVYKVNHFTKIRFQHKNRQVDSKNCYTYHSTINRMNQRLGFVLTVSKY